jgi:periplasmic protein TonB
MVETTTAVLDSLFQKNTISLAGQTLKNGNKNMSYHVQKNTQQRSIGIFIVIAFHVLLIWALANGLGKTIVTFIAPDPIQLTPVEKQIVPPPIEEPQEPVIDNRTKIIINTNISTKIAFDDVQPPLVTDGGSGESVMASSLSKPKLLKASKPEYPSAAARLGEEGATSLKLLISTDGRVADALVVTSSGSNRLDEVAIKHAKRNWAFSPCMEGGKAVACWHQTKLVWQLKDAGR